MAGYGDVSSRRFLSMLSWLENHKAIRIVQGGRHNVKVEAVTTGQSFPIPTSHRVINKHIVKAFADWLELNGVCSKQEFDKRL